MTPPAGRTCRNCGTPLGPQIEFCPQCGARNDPQNDPPPSILKRLITLLSTIVAVFFALLFGLMGACLVLAGFPGANYPGGGVPSGASLAFLAVGIASLFMAARIVRGLLRRGQKKT